MPQRASAMPTYCRPEILFHSWKTINPTAMVLNISRESTMPDVIASPSFEVVSPKVMKTIGEIIRTASSQKENLSSPLAQRVLIVFANKAMATAPMM